MIGTERNQNLSPTRLAIIRLLKEWGKGTATQLGKALGISRVAAHQHLDWLKEQGLVQVKVERKGRGRPAEVFSLTELAQEQFFPRRYDVLAFTALDEVASELGDKFLLRIFRRYREKLTERLRSVKGDLRERVQTLAELFTEEGYLASLEETDDGFVLSFINCPIAQIARRFQEACISEEEVLTKILDMPVTSECRQSTGSTCCRYFIAKPKGKVQNDNATRRAQKPNKEVV
jgi:predicted ArsR family transcriptional regulator